MNEQSIDSLKQAMRELMRIIAQRGRPLSPEVKEMLAKVIEHVGNRIQELRQQDQGLPGAPIEAPQNNLQNTPYPSSNINAFQYDPDSGRLLVKFMGKDTADAGPTYSYSGVPKYIFDVLKRGSVGPKTSGSNRWHTWKKGVTPSHGAAMAALVKAGGFSYQKVA